MTQLCEGRVAVIAGEGRGIGPQCALMLAAQWDANYDHSDKLRFAELN